MHYLRRAKDLLVEILEELWSPPSVAAVCDLLGITVIIQMSYEIQI
jgi:hypothetical protein